MRVKADPILNITDFESLSLFLREFYRAKKQREPTFSYEKWSRMLGSKNRSYLQLLVSGKRKVNDEYRQLFLEYFRFNSEERQHFLDLTDLGVTRSGDLKQNLQKSVRRRQKRSGIRKLGGHEAFMSNIKIPALLGLTSFKDFNGTLENLCQKINEPATVVKDWLTILENLDLVIFDQETQSWKATLNEFIMPSKSGAEAMVNYHRMCLEHAAQALKSPEGSRTKQQGFIICLNSKQLDELQTRAQDLALNLASDYESEMIEDREMYQWTWCLFPLTGVEKV